MTSKKRASAVLMTPTSPHKFTGGSPEQLWQTTLDQLKLQMTQATYDSWVRDTCVVSGDISGDGNDISLIIGVKNAFAKDWLENRLLPTIKRTVTSILERPVDIRFVVEAVPAAPTGRDRPASNEQEAEELQEPGMAFARETDFYAGKNKMGHWAAEFEYDLLFWSVYLGPAYPFWRYLIAHWVNSIKQKDFPLLDLGKRKNQGWTPPFKLSYRAATEALGKSNYAVIPGGIYECHETLARVQMRKRFPDLDVPLRSTCCGAHECHEWRPQEEGGGRCYYWREGLSHKLHRERILAVEVSTTGRATCQVLRVLPLLTPWQVATGIPDLLHAKHEKWLEKYAEAYFGITPEQWETITLRQLTPYMFNDDLKIANYGQPPQNPFATKK